MSVFSFAFSHFFQSEGTQLEDTNWTIFWVPPNSQLFWSFFNLPSSIFYSKNKNCFKKSESSTFKTTYGYFWALLSTLFYPFQFLFFLEKYLIITYFTSTKSCQASPIKNTKYNSRYNKKNMESVSGLVWTSLGLIKWTSTKIVWKVLQ